MIPALLLATLLQAPSVASAPESRPSLRLPAITFALAQAGDIATTCALIRHPTFREGNAFVGSSCPRIAATKTAVSGVLLWASSRVAKHHARAASVMLWTMAGVSLAPVVWNLHQFRR